MSTPHTGGGQRSVVFSFALIVIIVIALLLTRLVSYTLFHSLAEIFYAMIGFTVFLMAWTLRDFLEDDFPVFLGVSLFAGALLHMVHMVDFPGVNIIVSSRDKPTQVWLAATLLQSASFLAAPFVIGRHLRLRLVLAGYLVAVALILCSVYWWDVFPVALGPDGLTTFKVVGEYVACVLLAGGIVLFWRRRQGLQRGALPLLIGALLMRIVAELWFTLYTGPHQWPNLLGHVFLVFSIWLVYLAVVQDSLAVPHALAVVNLRLSEQAAQEGQLREQLMCEALDRLLALTPSFHEQREHDQVATAVCRAAREVFACDRALLFRVDGEDLTALAADPPTASMRPGTRYPLADDPELSQALVGRRPSFCAEIRECTLRFRLAALVDEMDLYSVLRAPIGLGPVGERLLMLGWVQPHHEPDAPTLALVQRFSDQVDVALTQARRHEAQQEAEALHRRFERSLLPNLPVEHPNLLVRSFYRPGEHRMELGGDFIDVLEHGERGLAVIVGDVSGHGPDSAALGATLRAAWQALELADASPSEIVHSLGRLLVRERSSPETYATFCLAWIDPRGDEVSLLNIAHPPPLLLNGEVTRLAVPPHPPLGSFDVPLDEPVRVALSPGWNLFFYTDGLIEGRAAPGLPERFGEERLFRALQTFAGQTLDERNLERLLTSIEESGGEPFTDDVTVVVVSRKE